MKIAVIGAGKTGRGFIGRLLQESGQEFLLVDKNQDLIRELECFFGFWQMQKPLLDALKMNGLSGVLLDRVSHSFQQLSLNRMKSGENEFFHRQIVWFAVSGIMTMVINWHNDGLRESAWAMAAVTGRILNTKLSDSLQH